MLQGDLEGKKEALTSQEGLALLAKGLDSLFILALTPT